MQTGSSVNTTPSTPVCMSLSDSFVRAGVQPHSHGGGPIPAKVFHDRIHDQIKLPGALVAIIDTPQFQRLRDLKQLGFSDLVFPGGTHTRFEHSVGVAHLAMTMLRQIVANHADTGHHLDVTAADVLCVGIAGLCHDLGHGPASHMFEHFVNEARRRRGVPGHWAHEDASSQLLDYLLAVNGVQLDIYGLCTADIKFVKALIKGLKPHDAWPDDIGRPKGKRFLFDIVANKRNGIDVDKMDYFMRDSVACFGHMPDVQVTRIINCARVIESEGETQICYEEKVALTLSALFNLRAKLHKFVYQHRTVKLVEQMVLDALLLAEEGGFSIPVGVDGRAVRISDTVDDMGAYTVTTDWIFRSLMASTAVSLAPARTLMLDITCRRLYRLVGCCEVERKPEPEEILEHLPPHLREQITADCVVPLAARILYGSSGDSPGDPIRNVCFFNPKKSLTATTRVKPGQISKLFTPREYLETTLFVYSRFAHAVDPLARAFAKWQQSAGATTREAYPFINASPGRSRPRHGKEVSPDRDVPLF